MPNSLLNDHEASFSFAEEQFFQEQHRYREVARGEPSHEDLPLLETSAVVLEIFALAGCLLERTRDDGELETTEAIRLLGDQTGIDVRRTLRDLGRLRSARKSGKRHRIPDLEGFGRVAEAVLTLCPVSQLQRHSEALNHAPLGHRIRVAYDALAAFLVRHDPGHERRQRIVGGLYMEGAVSVPMAADLLDIPIEDAAAVLESGGYARPLNRLLLEPEDRAARLTAIRRERLERSGLPEYDPERVARNVIASERLENVDARQWVRPAPRE